MAMPQATKQPKVNKSILENKVFTTNFLKKNKKRATWEKKKKIFKNVAKTKVLIIMQYGSCNRIKNNNTTTKKITSISTNNVREKKKQGKLNEQQIFFQKEATKMRKRFWFKQITWKNDNYKKNVG
ncbi:hypothetical protein RFI_03505 [Reticulomyxa filosa]|uniref:Uncharacterized protein n=1 Tax=Reticulomyxa filosa TaxID=46433 RepID=X6P5W7_RETFI|nr:hypothetical protein RFI_03505 [Reticulomyxa filosa]|eukprot:ETO33596.1 hypothetical protein RFI_03505 [Reticulomyxa filosa]